MKKLLFVAALGVAGLVSAASPTEKKVNKNVRNDLSIFKPPYVFQAYAAYDGPDGTCFVWGTFTLNTSQGTFQFAPSSAATQATMIGPPCTGSGSNLV